MVNENRPNERESGREVNRTRPGRRQGVVLRRGSGRPSVEQAQPDPDAQVSRAQPRQEPGGAEGPALDELEFALGLPADLGLELVLGAEKTADAVNECRMASSSTASRRPKL